jgi:SM-20-related protein
MQAQTAASVAPSVSNSMTKVIDLDRISRSQLQTEPYRWAAIDGLYSKADAAALAATFPTDGYKRVADHVGEKKHDYLVRSLVRRSTKSVSGMPGLSSVWRALGEDFLSPHYRRTMSELIGVDLTDAEFEVNVFDYPPGALHGAHTDHAGKIVTHVLYFNEAWDDEDGGCLTILKSRNPADVFATVSPIVGNSAVLVRSDDSWHAVSGVARTSQISRRSLTATFYYPGHMSSTVWPTWSQYLASIVTTRWQRLRGLLNGGNAGRM